MGERSNIRLTYADGNKIVFYTHLEGKTLPETLKKAIKRSRSRWHDESYLARIIFSEMIKDDIDGKLGFGIHPGEVKIEEYKTLEVNIPKRTINGVSFLEFIQ